MDSPKYRKPKGGASASPEQAKLAQDLTDLGRGLVDLEADLKKLEGQSRGVLRTDLIGNLQAAQLEVERAIKRLNEGRPKHYPEK